MPLDYTRITQGKILEFLCTAGIRTVLSQSRVVLTMIRWNLMRLKQYQHDFWTAPDLLILMVQ